MEPSIEQNCKSNEAFLKEKNIVDWYSFLEWSKDMDKESDEYLDALDNISFFYECKKINDAKNYKTLEDIVLRDKHTDKKIKDTRIYKTFEENLRDKDIERDINNMKDKHLFKKISTEFKGSEDKRSLDEIMMVLRSKDRKERNERKKTTDGKRSFKKKRSLKKKKRSLKKKVMYTSLLIN